MLRLFRINAGAKGPQNAGHEVSRRVPCGAKGATKEERTKDDASIGLVKRPSTGVSSGTTGDSPSDRYP